MQFQLPPIQICDGSLPKMLCECGRTVTRKNISTHRKTAIHKTCMEAHISGPGDRKWDTVPEVPVNALEVAQILNKSKIRFLPQPIQDAIYEYAADRTAKDQFIKCVPALSAYSMQPTHIKEVKFRFHKTHFQVMLPNGFQYLITPISSVKGLSDYVYKHARRWWANETEYDVNDKIGSLRRILRSTYGLPNVDTLHIITGQTFHLLNYMGQLDEDEFIEREIVPIHLRYLVSSYY